MTIKAVTPILNVTSIANSFPWFELFGWKRGFSWNDGGMIATGADQNEDGPAGFGSICCGEAQIFLSVGAQGSRGTQMPKFPGDDETDGVWMTWWMESIEDLNQLHLIAQQNKAMIT